MNTIRWWLQVPVLAAGLFFVSVLPSQSTVIDQMSFEDVARQADVVLIGRIVEKPELGVYDEVSKHLRVFNRVRVEEYLKGDGPSEVTVVTFGGQFDVDTDEGPQRQEIVYFGVAQLPDEGSEVLLFLKRYQNNFVIYSASHGVVLVQGVGEDRWVYLLFRESSTMPTLARRDYERARRAEYSGTWLLFGDRVLIRDLPTLMDHVLRGNANGDVLPIESYVPDSSKRTKP